jgi:hypothetical protein
MTSKYAQVVALDSARAAFAEASEIFRMWPSKRNMSAMCLASEALLSAAEADKAARRARTAARESQAASPLHGGVKRK